MDEQTIEETRYDVGKWRATQREQARQAEREKARKILHSDYQPPEYEDVSLADLRIDERYQRTRSENKVNLLRAHFQPNACQPLSVSCRANGTRYLVDGQHRAAVLQDIGLTTWPALLYRNLTPRDEAAMWKEVNTRQTKPKVADRFRAGLLNKEPEPIAIKALVIGAGMQLNFRSGYGAGSGNEIRAIEALETIYRKHKAPLLSDVLQLLQKAWIPEETQRTSRVILLGLATFLSAKWKNPVKLARAAERIGQYTPAAWIAKTRVADGRPGDILCAAFRKTYNVKARRDETL
jgi:hypothetical protein